VRIAECNVHVYVYECCKCKCACVCVCVCMLACIAHDEKKKREVATDSLAATKPQANASSA
jgi:hypothetical protein